MFPLEGLRCDYVDIYTETDVNQTGSENYPFIVYLHQGHGQVITLLHKDHKDQRTLLLHSSSVFSPSGIRPVQLEKDHHYRRELSQMFVHPEIIIFAQD